MSLLSALNIGISGLQASGASMAVVGNNIANANTTGFKANDAFTIALNKKTSAQSGNPAFSTTDKVMYNTYTDYSAGVLKETNRELDLAINGTGYFLMQGDNGIDLTRKGDFQLDTQGNIVNDKGDFLLGTKGIITVEDDTKQVVVNKSGELYMDGEYYDTLMITELDNPNQNLNKKDNGLFELTSTQDYRWTNPNGNKVFQGYLEDSNVNPLKEMVKMIENEKSFNLNQKVIQAIDATLNTSVNQIGKV